MDLTFAHICPSAESVSITLFCFFWPLVTIAVVRKRGHSAVPACAMLLPLAVSLLGTWLVIYNVLQGMPLAGGGLGSVAAGFAEALRTFFTGALSVLGVAVVAVLKRHRPVVDRVTAAIALLLIAETAGAVLFLRFFSLRIVALVFMGIAVAGTIAMACAAWLLVVRRGWLPSRPLPHAAAAIAACLILLGAFVWYDVHQYTDIAMHGVARR